MGAKATKHATYSGFWDLASVSQDVWGTILSSLDAQNLASFAQTCKFASQLARNPKTKETVLQNTFLEHIIYKDSNQKEIKTKKLVPAKPRGCGKLVIRKVRTSPGYKTLHK